MGGQQSIQSPTLSNERRRDMPPQTSCPNDITCQNFDFAANAFACPGASCGRDGKCSCGPNCTPLRGTCCKEVVWDPGMRTYKCQELSQLQTKAPSGKYSNPELDNLKNEINRISRDSTLSMTEKRRIIDELQRRITAIEDSERNTKSPLVYDPYDLDMTYRPVAPTPTPMPMGTTQPFIEETCLVSDKTYQGVTVPGKVICDWYNSA